MRQMIDQGGHVRPPLGEAGAMLKLDKRSR